MDKPRIGVVIPTLNSAAFLEWTLLGLRAQRGVDVEIVVADSGSTDGTLDLCRRWDVPVVYEPPGSLYRAVNAGMRSLTALPWVTYVNSDDVVYPDAYARLLARGAQAGADVVYGDADFVDEFGRFLYAYRAAPPALAARLARYGTLGFAQPAAVFRRALFDPIGRAAGRERV